MHIFRKKKSHTVCMHPCDLASTPLTCCCFLPWRASMKWQLVVLVWDYVEDLQRSVHKPKVELCTCDLIGKILILPPMACVFCFFRNITRFGENGYIMGPIIKHSTFLYLCYSYFKIEYNVICRFCRFFIFELHWTISCSNAGCIGSLYVSPAIH